MYTVSQKNWTVLRFQITSTILIQYQQISVPSVVIQSALLPDCLKTDEWLTSRVFPTN